MQNSCYRPLSADEMEDVAGRILYEDNHIIIFNKRVGEIVQQDKTGDEALCDTLKAFIAIRDSKPGRVFVGVPHRLDRPVSGAVIFAKTSKALSRLDEMFRRGLVRKTYWALCCGTPALRAAGGQPTAPAASAAPADVRDFAANSGSAAPAGDGWFVLENLLWRNEKQNKSYIVGADAPRAREAKAARLRCRLAGHSDRYHLMEVELLTGRHHQIRCQLAGIGCVIKGDLKYGAPRSNPDGGICLMARSVSFEHPVSHRQIFIEAPVPSGWPPLVVAPSI